MPLPYKLRDVEKVLAQVLPHVEAGLAGCATLEEAARCLRLLGRHQEAVRCFMAAASAVATLAELENHPADLVQAGNFCRLAWRPVESRGYLERAVPLLVEEAAKYPILWDAAGALVEAHFLLDNPSEVDHWIEEYHKRLRSKKLRRPDLARLLICARSEGNADLAREVMTLSQSWIRGDRSKPWWTGATISLYDYYDMAEELLIQSAGGEEGSRAPAVQSEGC